MLFIYPHNIFKFFFFSYFILVVLSQKRVALFIDFIFIMNTWIMLFFFLCACANFVFIKSHGSVHQRKFTNTYIYIHRHDRSILFRMLAWWCLSSVRWRPFNSKMWLRFSARERLAKLLSNIVHACWNTCSKMVSSIIQSEYNIVFSRVHRNAIAFLHLRFFFLFVP